MKRLKLAVALLSLAVLLVTTVPAILAQSGLSRQPFEWIIAKQLTVDGFIMDRPMVLRLQDVKDDAGGNVVDTEVTTGSTTITTSITNPDYPRNVAVVLTQSTTYSTEVRTAGNVLVTGVDARGNPRVEVLAMTALSTTETLTGSVPWATISQFEIPAQTFPITVTVSLGKKFGLPKSKLVATNDVYFFTINNAYTSAVTIDATNATFAPDVGVTANDDFTVWMKQ